MILRAIPATDQRQSGIVVELPMRIIGREQQQLVRSEMLDQPLHRAAAWAPSTGWVVRRTCWRTISAGERSTHGTSSRSPRQNLVSRQRWAGSQGHAGFDQHHAQVGELGEHALAHQAGQRRLEGGRLGGVVFRVVARPADGRDRVTIGAASMDADRQSVLLAASIDRPVLPLAQRRVAHHKHQTCTKRWSGGDAMISSTASSAFCVGITIEARSRGSSIQPLAGDPVVNRAGEAGAHVFAEQKLHAVQAVADGEPSVPNGSSACRRNISRSEPGLPDTADASPARGQGRFDRIGDRFEIVQSALHNGIAPVSAR